METKVRRVFKESMVKGVKSSMCVGMCEAASLCGRFDTLRGCKVARRWEEDPVDCYLCTPQPSFRPTRTAGLLSRTPDRTRLCHHCPAIDLIASSYNATRVLNPAQSRTARTAPSIHPLRQRQLFRQLRLKKSSERCKFPNVIDT